MVRRLRLLPLLALPLLASPIACGGQISPTGSTDTGVTSDGAGTDAADSAPLDAFVPDAWPDAAPDTGTALTATCAAAGGALCTNMRWDICPAGFEPAAGTDPHLGCGTGGGWCCIPAAVTPCSASGNTNCVAGTCTGCWMSVATTGLWCEPGRSCCQDACD